MQRLALLVMALFLAPSSLLAAMMGCGPVDLTGLTTRAGGSIAVEIAMQTPVGRPAYGTGIIWDERGHIVTNDHVAAAGSRHTVKLPGGEQRSARLLARAPGHDLALLLVEGPLPSPAPRRMRAVLRPGDGVLAVGNPFGHGLSITSGEISGFNREVMVGPQTRLWGMIETKTSLKPGHSGGPLLNCDGEVVGINTAALQTGSNGADLGFAIPIQQAAAVVDSMLQASGSLVAAMPVDPRKARPGLGLYVVPNGDRALLVQGVVPGSPAALAGARPGDAIIGANGRQVSSAADLQSLVERAGNGKVTILRIVRSGTQLDMAVRISPVVFSP